MLSKTSRFTFLIGFILCVMMVQLSFSQRRGRPQNVKTQTKDGRIFSQQSKSLFDASETKKKKASPEMKKFIGEHFPIERFQNKQGKAFPKDQLKGKPSIISIWKSSNASSAMQIYDLNALEQKWGNKVNFMGITPDNKRDIQRFSSRYDLDFPSISSSRDHLDKLGFHSYPLTLILDKNGLIKKIMTQETNQRKIQKILKKLL